MNALAETPETRIDTDDDRRRWLALYVLCAGVLMIVLDATIVNVALPSIQDDLGFSQIQPRVGRQRLPDRVRRRCCCSPAGSAISSASGGSS